MSAEGTKSAEANMIGDSDFRKSHRRDLGCVAVTIAWLLAIASLVLCAIWASYNAPGINAYIVIYIYPCLKIIIKHITMHFRSIFE